MKKIILTAILLSLVSCYDSSMKVQPAEVYKNKGVIVIEEPIYPPPLRGDGLIKVKNKDSVFTIRLPQFDAKRQVVGDSIK